MPHADATVSLKPQPAAPLSDVLYADTRTAIYTALPAADPKTLRIKVVSIAGVACCVPEGKVRALPS
eukprot:SAG11_NODE_1083_length_5951_cov_7.969925_4_plen_67_part_00